MKSSHFSISFTDNNRLAPRITIIELSPFLSTKIGATPVAALSVINTLSVSM